MFLYYNLINKVVTVALITAFHALGILSIRLVKVLTRNGFHGRLLLLCNKNHVIKITQNNII